MPESEENGEEAVIEAGTPELPECYRALKKPLKKSRKMKINKIADRQFVSAILS